MYFLNWLNENFVKRSKYYGNNEFLNIALADKKDLFQKPISIFLYSQNSDHYDSNKELMQFDKKYARLISNIKKLENLTSVVNIQTELTAINSQCQQMSAAKTKIDDSNLELLAHNLNTVSKYFESKRLLDIVNQIDLHISEMQKYLPQAGNFYIQESFKCDYKKREFQESIINDKVRHPEIGNNLYLPTNFHTKTFNTIYIGYKIAPMQGNGFFENWIKVDGNWKKMDSGLTWIS